MRNVFLFFVFFACERVNAVKKASLIPLNFVDAIENIKDKLENPKTMSQIELNFLNSISFNQEEFLVDQIGQLISSNGKAPRSISLTNGVNQPNITAECLSQFVQLYVSFKKMETWALSGILNIFFITKLRDYSVSCGL